MNHISLLTICLLFLAPFLEAVGAAGGPAQLTRGSQEVWGFFQLQPCPAFNLPVRQEVQEPDLFCWFYSAQGPTVGRCTLQLKAIFHLRCISHAVLSWPRWCLGLHVSMSRTVSPWLNLYWSLQSTSKAGCSYGNCVAIGHMEVQVM